MFKRGWKKSESPSGAEWASQRAHNIESTLKRIDDRIQAWRVGAALPGADIEGIMDRIKMAYEVKDSLQRKQTNANDFYGR